MSEKEKVEGYVEHIIFRNEENGYTVLNLSMKGRELTCVGTLPMIDHRILHFGFFCHLW